MDTFEVLDGSGASQVEQIAADAHVASAQALAGGDMSEGVFDGGAVAEGGTACTGLLELSVLALAGLVGGDRDGAPAARCGLGALCAQWACAARLGVELDGIAGLEGLHFASRAGDRAGAQVDLEVAFGEQAGSMGALAPRLGEHGAARGEDVVDDGAVYVGAIDMQLDESKPLALDILGDGHGAQLLGAIGGRHSAGDDRGEVQVARDVLLVAIEALRAALAPVTHLAVAHRDTPVGCDALPDASATVRRDFQVLRAHLREGFDVRAQRLGPDVAAVTLRPAPYR